LSGGFWVCFEINYDHRYYLMRFDADGVPVFDDPILAEDELEYITDYQEIIAPDGQGGLYFAYGHHNTEGDNGGLYANRFDSLGVPLYDEFQHIYFTEDIWNTYCFPASGGDAVITWLEAQYDPDYVGALQYCTRIQPDLSFVWQDEIVTATDTIGSSYFKILLYRSGGFILTSAVYGPPAHDGLICHVDSSGISRYTQIYQEFPHTVTPGDDGSAFLGYKEWISSRDVNFWFTKLDPNGNPAWNDSVYALHWTEYYWPLFSVPVRCSDGRGGIIFVVNTATNNNGGVVGRITADGYLGFSPDAVDPRPPPLPESFTVALYPNPFNSRVTLSFSHPRAVRSISVYNLLGRKIAAIPHGPFFPTTVNWDAAPLTSGTYFFVVEGIDQTTMKRCILLR